MCAVNSAIVNTHMKDTKTTTQTDETVETTEAQATGLSIQDVLVLRQCVEVAAQRGAYKAEEMTTIGATYDRLTKWLEAHMPAPDNESESEERTEADSEEGEADA